MDATQFRAATDAHYYGARPRRSIMPWQLWVVSVLLAVEGILGNLPLIFSHPIAATWFLSKCLFITGFFFRWRPVFVIFLIEAAIHTLVFATSAPGVALINLAMLILVASSVRHFFPAQRSSR